MAEGAVGTGGAMLPMPLSAQVIDRARNTAAVFRAGARTVPMEGQTLTLPRWVADPTAVWHTENAVISSSDPTLEAVQLKAQTLTGLVTLSRELLEDTNVDAELVRIFAEVFALKLDQAALRDWDRARAAGRPQHVRDFDCEHGHQRGGDHHLRPAG
jgi:HK97 family phage major capsid protein